MRAVRLIEPGLIEIQEIDEPLPGDGEVMVKVHAAAITRGELDWPLDRLPATPSSTSSPDRSRRSVRESTG